MNRIIRHKSLRLWEKVLSTAFILLMFVMLLPTSQAIADTPWPMFMHDPQRSGVSPYLGPQSDVVAWVFSGVPISGRGVAQPIIGSDGTIYILYNSFNDLYAVGSDGNLKWGLDLPGGVDPANPSPAISLDGTIYVPAAYSQGLFALDPNGLIKWSYPLEGPSAPAIGSDGVIYIGSGSLYAINPDRTLKWKCDEVIFGGQIAIGPDGTIYVPDYRIPGLAAVDSEGRLKWSVITGYISGTPAIGPDSTIYFPIEAGDTILAISPSGQIKWGFSSWDSYFLIWSAAPLAVGSDGSVYCGHDRWLYAISPNGELKWKFEVGGISNFNTPNIDSDGTIYIGSSNGVYAINADGTLKWKYPNPNQWYGFLGSSIGSNGMLYVVHGSGELYAFGGKAPMANAGSDQTVHEGSIVTLDGSGSSDPNGNLPLTYAWGFVSRPDGSTATLSDPTVVNPTFTADQRGDYVVQLVVTNSLRTKSSPATVTISTNNTPPVADPGPDQAITSIGTTVVLDGSKSYDFDGDPLTYYWTFYSKPDTSSATLDGANTSNPTFVADVHGTYIIQLVVRDPWIASDPKKVTVSFTNIAPVANAGTSQSVALGDTVYLNGSGSTDANGDPLTYQWSFVSVPTGGNAAIANPTAVQTGFVPDLWGTYVVQLVVNDGFVNSNPSMVTIQVTVTSHVVIQVIQTSLQPQISALNPMVFKNANMQNALLNKLNAVIANIDAGNYADALGQLQEDVLGKTDGCANSGAPDKNDWITTCADQRKVYPLIMQAIKLLSQL